jgi:hypothetical protein
MKQDYNASADVSDGSNKHIGFIQTHEYGGSGHVEKVVLQLDDNTNPSLNVQVDGSALFTSPVTLAAANTPETFIPNQNRSYTGPSVEALVSVRTSASATNNLDVGLLVDDGHSS